LSARVEQSLASTDQKPGIVAKLDGRRRPVTAGRGREGGGVNFLDGAAIFDLSCTEGRLPFRAGAV
jgi:hypothetical protein